MPPTPLFQVYHRACTEDWGVLKEELDKRVPILPNQMSLVTVNTRRGLEEGRREGGGGGGGGGRREGGREGGREGRIRHG